MLTARVDKGMYNPKGTYNPKAVSVMGMYNPNACSVAWKEIVKELVLQSLAHSRHVLLHHSYHHVGKK